jgi:predicted kinase
MKDMIMMIGAAGSGKSTWTKKFLATTDKEYVVLGTDAIFVEWGNAIGINYSEAFAHFKYKDVEKEFNMRLGSAFAAGKNVIWDQTNLTLKSRSAKLAQVPKAYKKRAVVFNLPKAVVMERARNEDRIAEGKKIPTMVIHSMFKQFEMPDQFEFDEIIEVITA